MISNEANTVDRPALALGIIYSDRSGYQKKKNSYLPCEAMALTTSHVMSTRTYAAYLKYPQGASVGRFQDTDYPPEGTSDMHSGSC